MTRINGRRSETRDGFRNRLDFFFLTRFRWLIWNPIQAIGFFRSIANRKLIERAIGKTPARPYALSTKYGYTTWDSLTDRSYSGRHLPPARPRGGALPPVQEVVELFRRPAGGMVESEKSTVLFSYFAQWFTDGFLRTDYRKSLKNTSNHDIDLSNLYGLKAETTRILRSRVDGKLKSQIINGEEYPPFYYQNGRPDPNFVHLPMTHLLPRFEATLRRKPVDADLFAVGGDRVNSHVGFLAMNVLFFREHNRICEVLKRQKNPPKNDRQLFHTARNVLIVLLIKIVIEEYINHITPYHFKFHLQPAAFEGARWYRQNWMAIEFNLLYRWHALVPDTYRIDGKEMPLARMHFHNRPLIDRGLGGLLEDASQQPAGRIGLFNTPAQMLDTEEKSVKLGRRASLDNYNAYRRLCKFPEVTSFDQISGDGRVQDALKDLYKTVDRIEYYPGIFAEDTRPSSALPSLIGRLVGVDAFSQALTNPLLASNIYNERTFTPAGMEIIETTKSLSDILHRNLPAGSGCFEVSMDRKRTVHRPQAASGDVR